VPELQVVAVVVAAGLAIGAARGGRLSALGAASLRGGRLVAAAAAAALAGQLLPLGPWPGLASLAALLGAAWCNRFRSGAGLVAAGLLLNAAVIAVNGGMPVSASAVAAVGGAQVVADGLHVPLREGDPLAVLGDVIAVPPLRAVVSAGDLALSAGAVLLLGDLMGAGRGRTALSRPRSGSRTG